MNETSINKASAIKYFLLAMVLIPACNIYASYILPRISIHSSTNFTVLSLAMNLLALSPVIVAVSYVCSRIVDHISKFINIERNRNIIKFTFLMVLVFNGIENSLPALANYYYLSVMYKGAVVCLSCYMVDSIFYKTPKQQSNDLFVVMMSFLFLMQIASECSKFIAV